MPATRGSTHAPLPVLAVLAASAFAVARASAEPGTAGIGAKKVGFTVTPKEGPASGGTMVTLHMNPSDVPLTHAKWWCAFGDKKVPAQSFFMIPSETHGERGNPALLCVAPAGPVRGTVPVKISLDGKRFYAGGRFYYNDKGLYYKGGGAEKTL